MVVGPPGCGKSECIKTFAVAERERGKYINVQSIFTKAVETGELFGSYDIRTRFELSVDSLISYNKLMGQFKEGDIHFLL